MERTFLQILQTDSATRNAQLVVFREGQKILDLSGNEDKGLIADKSTPFLTFSVSKAFTTAAILRLLDQGRLELDSPVATYWPEFGRDGKENATIRHVLLHQAGVPAPHLYRQIFMWPSWNTVTRTLARTPAEFSPGSRTAYHLVNFGFILGEVVRRVSGIPVDEFLTREFFEPMRLKNIWMRIPSAELRRSPKVFAADAEMRKTAALFNLPVIRRALIPAAGLHSSANDLAAFFQMLLSGGSYLGRQYLQPETIKMAAQSHYDGYDDYIQGNMNWGLGFIIGGSKFKSGDVMLQAMGYGSSASTFAAFGMGTCMVWADWQAKIVTAFTCDGMLSDREAGKRWSFISNAVWSCISEKKVSSM